jgi:hypothetical protein
MKSKFWLYCVAPAIVLAGACENDHYGIIDFDKVKKIDTHMHLNAMSTALAEQAKADNFRLLTVGVDAPSNPPLAEQEKFALHQVEQFPDRISYVTTFTLEHWDSAAFASEIIAQLKASFSAGALGIKIWKNIGMVYKDSADQFIMIDDPKFDPIIDYIIGEDKTVLGHLGEPKNCWLPLDMMTVKNDREYFKNHPQYHMFLHPESPSYEDQINARDRFVERHPAMRFVGAHLGSLEWDVDELAKRLDKFPNMAVDMAARIPHLQFQSQANREKVAAFLIKYQDRIIYATDSGISGDSNPEDARRNLHNTWLQDWKYFVSDEMMTAVEVDGEFQGLNLPKEVIDKIYRQNAIRWFKMEE